MFNPQGDLAPPRVNPTTARLRFVVAALVLLSVACAPGANPHERTVNALGVTAGFWLGLWHGMITPITFVISLFNPHVAIYEVHNRGGWYDAGYVFGLLMSLGGSGRASPRGGPKPPLAPSKGSTAGHQQSTH